MRKRIPRDLVNSLWNAAKSGQYVKNIKCPSCSQMMAEVPVPGESFAIDVCPGCAWVWFDAEEYQLLPRLPKRESSQPAMRVSPELAQRYALHQMEQVRQKARRTKESPNEAWKYIPALLGVPVEFDCEATQCRPVATWILLGLISVVSLWGFAAGRGAVEQFGLIPAEWSRFGGLTLVTSFFFHGGIRHLLGNLYFLFVFGDNVEDFLGRSRYLMLLAAATLAGGLMHVMIHPDSMTPCIGASGGISGILAYYALRFPRHRIGFLFFFVKWLRFPVIGYFAFWVILQLLGALSGAGNVAYMAHIGGLLTGVVFWASERFFRVSR